MKPETYALLLVAVSFLGLCATMIAFAVHLMVTGEQRMLRTMNSILWSEMRLGLWE